MNWQKCKYNTQVMLNHLEFMNVKRAAHMIDGVFRSRVLKQNRVRNCQIAVTFRCNHNCKFCSSLQFYRKDKKELSLLEWKCVVNQLKALGCTHFDITGGEPTLKDRMWFLYLLIYDINKHNDRVVSLATNGKTVDRIDLEAYQDAGLTVIEFDLQSTDAEYHDELVRDKGNHARIMRLIPIAQDIGLKVCINTCFGLHNWTHIEQLMEWCDKHKVHLLLNLAVPCHEMANDNIRLMEVKDKYYKLLYSHPYARSDTTMGYRGMNLCPGGIEKLYITAYGDVMQCTFVPVSFGNVREEPLSVIYDRISNHPLIKTRSICKYNFNREFNEQWMNKIHGEQLPVHWRTVPYGGER